MPAREPDAPWGVKLFGEKRLNYIILDKAKLTRADTDTIDSLRRLFPEAEGIHIHEPGWSTRWPPEDLDSFFDQPPRGSGL